MLLHKIVSYSNLKYIVCFNATDVPSQKILYRASLQHTDYFELRRYFNGD